MSTSTKRTLADARRDAEAFRDLFDGCYSRWEIAGSVRRGKPEVGDIEHVIIPGFADLPDGYSMFGEPVTTNLMWRRLAGLVSEGVVAPHEYGNGRRWGEKYRGVDFRGFNHELFLADADNWGCILTIRTGPADFSQRMVTSLHGTMLRQRDGYLRYEDGKVYRCADERAFFAACRMPWSEPHAR